MIVKSRPILQFPDIELIKDKFTQNFGTELSEILIEAFRNIYDDITALNITAERVTSFPTANLASRGKIVLLEGTGGGADGLFLCEDTGGTSFTWKQITVAA